MKVLFIGGTGNISTSVSELCLSKGYDLFLLNRGKTRKKLGNATILIGNINDYKSIYDLIQNRYWDAVVNWIAFTKEDVERDIYLFSGKTKHYIFISSASAYQKPPQNPIITEDTPLSNPFWEYSRNKIECEKRLMKEYHSNGFPITIVRPSLTYNTVIPVPIGGWKEYTIIDRMKKGKKVIVHGDGTSLFTVTHAKDFAQGFIGLIGNSKAIGEAFHITSDEILTWDQIHQFIGEAIGIEPKIIHIPTDFIIKCEPSFTGTLLGDKSWSLIFDNSKIKKFVPEFKATILFRNGIKETLNWFHSRPERMFINPRTEKMIDNIIGKYEKVFNSIR